MILINEWLPNPVGSDTENEWIELFNAGDSAINLSGWVLATKGGKDLSLSGKTIAAKEYLLLPRGEIKFTLQNQDGALALYDRSGDLTDEAKFFGSAPEGKSFSRVGQGKNFIFSEPTPQKENVFKELALARDSYQPGQPLNLPLSPEGLTGLILGSGLAVTGLILFVLKRNEELSKLFFGKD